MFAHMTCYEMLCFSPHCFWQFTIIGQPSNSLLWDRFHLSLRRLIDITKTFQNISCNQICVHYLDDKNSYMNLEEYVMGELLSCLTREVTSGCLIKRPSYF